MSISSVKWPLLLLSATLLGCGGGGGGAPDGGTPSPPPPPPPPVTYTVGGTVTGLSGTLVLQNGGADDLTVSAGGVFTFSTALATGKAYSVAVRTQPASQFCDVENSAGTIAASNVTNITVKCSNNAPNTFTVSGTLSGSTGTVILQNNGGDDLPVAANGAFTFNAALAASSPYAVTVLTQPDNQTCLVANSAGVIGQSNVTDVRVTCTTNEPNTFTVGGTVSGLTGTVILENNVGNDLTIRENGAFTFNAALAANSPYAVTVRADPDNQSCRVTNGTGVIGQSNVTDVTVTCTTIPANTRALGVSVSGLSNNNVVLQNNGGNDVSVINNGSSDLGRLAVGSPYAVTVKTHPSYPAANCVVADGAGTIEDADVVVQVNCTDFAVPALAANVIALQSRAVSTAWSDPGSVASYELYASTRRDCDFRGNFMQCPGQNFGPRVPRSQTVTQFNGQPLKSGQAYFFRVETTYTNGAKGLSNEVGARPHSVAFNGPVTAITVAPDGTQYIGGEFSSVGVTTGSAVPFDLTQGKPTAPDFPVIAGTVYAVESDGVGGWFIGGEFTSVNGVSRENLVHIRADGTIDPNLPSLNGPVRALERIADTIYVGGSFDTIQPSGQVRDNLAAFDMNTGGLLNWAPNPNNTVRALQLLGDSIYVGGEFTAAGGPPGFLTRFLFNPFGAGPSSTPAPLATGFTNAVHRLAARGNSLYASGLFSFANDQHFGVARIDVNAGGVPALSTTFHPDPISGAANSARAIAVSNDGATLYIGGSFNAISGPAGRVNHLRLAAISTISGAVLPWAPNPDADVESLAVGADGTVYAGGIFGVIGAPGSRLDRKYLAAIHPVNGTTLAAFHPDPQGKVTALTVSGETLYAGGEFNHLTFTPRSRLAALDAEGMLKHWLPQTNGPINALLYHDNSTLGPVVYVGGSFTEVNQQPQNNLAALNATNAAMLPFAATNGEVNALAVLESATAVYVGGSFTFMNNPIQGPTGVNNLANLRYNGEVKPDFRAEPNGPVTALLATHDPVTQLDVVYAGGEFGKIKGDDHPFLAKLNSDNARPLQWTKRPNSGPVTALALSSDGHVVYAAGNFNAPAPGKLVAFDADGTIVLPEFDPVGATTLGDVSALALYPGDFVFAGGNFTNLGRQPVRNFTELRGYGDATAGNSTGSFVMPNGKVSALAVFGNKVFVGGTFSGVRGAASAGPNGPGVRGNYAVVDVATGALIDN